MIVNISPLFVDQGFDVNNGQMQNDDEFDVDNFLNQFGGTD
jgi:hypothetical protein